jgi:hypothetical protein
MRILSEKKPTALKGIADDTGKSEDEINKLWDKEVKALGKSEDELDGEDYGLLIGKVKDAAGVKGDVDSKTSGKNTNESRLSALSFLESTKSAKEYLA